MDQRILMYKILFGMISFFVINIYAASPSFDCNKVHSSKIIEQEICKDPVLAKKDTELSSTYSILLKSNKNGFKTALRASQRAWMKKRDHQCQNSDNVNNCLQDMYDGRVSFFKSVISRNKTQFLIEDKKCFPTAFLYYYLTHILYMT